MLMKRMEEKLAGLNPSLVSQAIYVLCNIASGTEKQKNVVMDSAVVRQVDSILVRLDKTHR
ncbi:MAG: hypothetical protein P4L51_20330 [Puia sp.]|nr:hypothetical protein [Puia sp.]